MIDHRFDLVRRPRPLIFRAASRAGARTRRRRGSVGFLAPLRKAEWVVYAKKPFGGPQAVLAYLSRYTHRVAISNRRLISADETGVTFNWKDYRIEGPDRYKTMTLPTGEFIRRFLTHVLPKGFHRILRIVRQRQSRRQHRAGA
jgi:hypothetical protein